MSLTVFVHTLGDMDNLYALLNPQGTNLEEASRNSVERQLQTQLKAQAEWGYTYKVVSHAFQGFTCTSVLKGGFVGKQLPLKDPKTDAYVKEKLENLSSTFVKPLELLHQHAYANPADHHFVVISVGRHDLRENLENPIEWLSRTPQIQRNCLAILDKIKSWSIDVKPIFVLPYLTHLQHDRLCHHLDILARRAALVYLSCMGTLGFLGILILTKKISASWGLTGLLITALVLGITDQVVPLRTVYKILQCQRPGIALMKVMMENLYRPLLMRAQREGIPIVDLTNTFNPHQIGLYAAGIEPSKEGGALIAKVICQVLQDRGRLPHLYTDMGSSEYIPSKWKIYRT